MSRIGFTTPENMRLILQVVKYLQENGMVLQKGQRGDYRPSNPPPIHVKNDSGEEIPPFACMQVTGTEEGDNINFLIVDKPVDSSMDDGAYVFNGYESISTGDWGVAHDGPVVRAKITGAVSVGDGYSPTAGQWYLTNVTGGLYRCLGDDDIATDVAKFAITNGPRIYAGSASGDISAASGSTWGSGTVVLKKIPGGSASSLSPSRSLTAYNPGPKILSGSQVTIMREFESGEWIVIASGGGCNPVVDVYIDSGYLKQAFCDGTVENIVQLTTSCP